MKILLVLLCSFVGLLQAQGYQDSGSEILDHIEHFEGFEVPETHENPSHVNEESTKSTTKLKKVRDSTVELKIKSVENETLSNSLENKEVLEVKSEVQNSNGSLEIPKIVLEDAEVNENFINSNETSDSFVVTPSEDPLSLRPDLVKLNSTTIQTTTVQTTTIRTIYTEPQTTFSELVIHLEPTTLAPVDTKKKTKNSSLPENCSAFKVIKNTLGLSIIIDKRPCKKSHSQVMSQSIQRISLDFD